MTDYFEATDQALRDERERLAGAIRSCVTLVVCRPGESADQASVLAAALLSCGAVPSLRPEMHVTAACFPMLHEVMEDISHDAGARAGHAYHRLGPEWMRWLPRVETALAALSRDDRQTLAIGCEEEMLAITGRGIGPPESAQSAVLVVAHALLHDYWENWMHDPTEERVS